MRFLKIFLKKKIPFQYRRKTYEKASKISLHLKNAGAFSVLDLGCNAGIISRYLGREGFFVVGIDKKFHSSIRFIANPCKDAFLGEANIDQGLVSKLPKFDAILLLSIHHQMVKIYGDEKTKEIFYLLSKKCRKIFLIEFSGRNKKYGKLPGDLFIDNDEKSVLMYCFDWLRSAMPDLKHYYVGKVRQVKKEPNRFLFKCLV